MGGAVAETKEGVMFYPLPFKIINWSREVTGRSLLGKVNGKT
jgi:hypothetical protein